MNPIKHLIAEAVEQLFGLSDLQDLGLTRPDPKFGDFATNIAMQLAPSVGKNPREIADQLAEALRQNPQFSEVSVAGPGFINIRLSDEALFNVLEQKLIESLVGKIIVAEYSDPNPFKVLHAGHLYTSLVGDAVGNLMAAAGATVHRVNFGGDVGLHVGRTMWSILQELGGEYPEKLSEIPNEEKLNWMSRHYVIGTAAYDENEQAKAEITELNQRVYALHANDDQDSPFAHIYWTCRQWSYDGFDDLYKRLEMTPFEKYYPESTVADEGLKTVRRHTGTVYEESNGAIVFKGEDYGLFTQVFINSAGLPTYAGKDVGLIYKKHEDFSPDMSFIITDIAQKDHLAVVMKSISLFAPELVKATTHFTHGQIKMVGGVKMSSRKGNILRADDILTAAQAAHNELTGADNSQTVLAAVKYAFLKNRIGGDIIYSPTESVAVEGNSGPYLQYAHARAHSILAKAGAKATQPQTLEPAERTLLMKISEYTEVVNKSIDDLMPHYICTYLYELAQEFNRFYEKNRVIDDVREAERLWLVEAYAEALKNGLNLLGITAPEKL